MEAFASVIARMRVSVAGVHYVHRSDRRHHYASASPFHRHYLVICLRRIGNRLTTHCMSCSILSLFVKSPGTASCCSMLESCRLQVQLYAFELSHPTSQWYGYEWAGWGKRFSGMQLLAFNVDLVASALLVVRYYQWKGSCTGTQTCARPVGTLLSFACTNTDTPVYVHFSKHTRSRAVDVFVHNE